MTTTTTDRYVILKDGKVVLSQVGRVESDGTVRLLNGKKWMPVAIRPECEARGLDPLKVIAAAAPAECLARPGVNSGGVEVLTVEEWEPRRRAATARDAESRDAKIEAAVPGVTELVALAARVEADRGRNGRQFARMMEDEGNDGVRPPAGVNEQAAAALDRMLRDNPRAALYLRAVRQSESGHWSDPTGANGAGKRAAEILVAGGSVADAAAALAERRPLSLGD